MSEKPSFKIEFVGEKEIPISKDQTILEAALEAGIPHFHSCGGIAECSTCRIIITDGIEKLSPPNEKEERLRTIVPFPPRVRLACQTCVNASDVKVKRIKVEKTELSYSVKQQINEVQQKLGEKRELILFFLDIRNFTPFVETYLPYDAIHVLRSCYVIFNHWVNTNKGVIIDTAGDGFYAVFGLETPIVEAAHAAINTGSEILKEMQRFNETFLDPYFGSKLEIGIGIHAGNVIVGEVVVGSKSHLSVTGLAVNIAARIQSSTKKLNNNFLASDEVMKYISTNHSGELRLIKLRGVSNVIKVQLIGEPYEVIVNP
jgi:adenylate cyclase